MIRIGPFESKIQFRAPNILTLVKTDITSKELWKVAAQ